LSGESDADLRARTGPGTRRRAVVADRTDAAPGWARRV